MVWDWERFDLFMVIYLSPKFFFRLTPWYIMVQSYPYVCKRFERLVVVSPQNGKNIPPELIWGNNHYFIEISNFIEDKTTWTISFWSLNITLGVLCFQVMIFDDHFLVISRPVLV